MFFFYDTATSEIYTSFDALALPVALPLPLPLSARAHHACPERRVHYQ